MPVFSSIPQKTDRCEENLYTVLIMIFSWKYSNVSTQRNQEILKLPLRFPHQLYNFKSLAFVQKGN